MGLLNPTDRSDLKDPEHAGQAMESMLLQRMLASANLMGKSNAPGAGMRSDLFNEAIADAVTAQGGLGIAKTLNAQAGAAGGAEGGQGAHDQKNDDPAKKISGLKPLNSVEDSHTALLSSGFSLIGQSSRTEDSLGEPGNGD